MKKRMLKSLMWLFIIATFLLSMVVFAFATDPNVISDVNLKHQTFIEDMQFGSNVQCSSLGGIGIGNNGNECFYALKASGYEQLGNVMQEQYANFYYFPNLSTMKTDFQNGNYGVYQLKYAGHANGMAVDSNNIYITGYVVNEARDGHTATGSNQQNNTYNNWIIMLPISVVSQMASNGFYQNGAYIPKYNANSGTNGYRILYPKIKNSNGNYVRYQKEITAITKYDTDGSFIINTEIPGISESDAFQFVKAEIKTINGSTEFVVSNNPLDYFLVENNLQQHITTPQDICYKPACGFFIPRFYGNNNSGKTVIAWADIHDTTNYQWIAGTNESYKMYTPTKINLNKTNYTEQSPATGQVVLKYSRFEVESIAISQDNNLYAGMDIALTSEYAGPNGNRQFDGIYKLTFGSPAKKFTLVNKPPVV